MEQNDERLEMISRLAGGIAHDYNNLLAVILLHADILTNSVDENVRRHAREIKHATQRASAVTRQLQAFGGAQLMRPQCLGLNEQISKLTGVLESILQPKSKLTLELDERVGSVDLDPVYFELILTNILNNARDAMPNGGQVELTTEAIHDSHVKIIVTDNGSGMDAETRERVFEPFFTTRKTNRHGLGLSTAHGLVKQMSGEIVVHSKLNEGTSVEIVLPQHDAGQVIGLLDELVCGRETILIVDDEAMVRNPTTEILEAFGYEVLEASSGSEALEICDECSEPVALLLVDLEMDEMDGPTVAAAIRQKWASVPVLFMSGLSEPQARERGLPTDRSDFIGKPFEPDELARRIRKLINVR